MHRPYLPVLHLFGSLERYLKLFGVVSIVINKRNTVPLTDFFKTSACTVELCQSLGNVTGLNSQDKCGGGCGQCVFNVMDTGDGKIYRCKLDENIEGEYVNEIQPKKIVTVRIVK